MFKSMERNKLGTRIVLGVFVGMIGVGMLMYLVPGGAGTDASGVDVVATVDGQPVTRTAVQAQLQKLQAGQQIPAALAPLYAQQIIEQLVFEKELEVEAARLGVVVSDAELADRIKLLLPTAFQNGQLVQRADYEAQVGQRFQMGVEEFEELVRQSLVQEKVGALVSAGVTVSPDEIAADFRRKNEKIKIDYAVIHPDALESQVQVTDADLSAYYDKNKTKYNVPEQRVVRYIAIDPEQLAAKINISQSELEAAYNKLLDNFKVPERAQISQILFKTIGKTDAEMAELRKKAADVDAQAKKGAKFDDLAKKYSEDPSTKDKGGDTGWIVRGQAMPELEKAAFSVPKGEVSDVIQTQIGLYIIKVTDKEQAHTKTLAEVMPILQGALAKQKADEKAEKLAQDIGDQLRQTAKPSLDAIAKQFDLTVAETQPIGVTDSAPELGSAPDIKQTVFRLRLGDVSQPERTDRGYIILSVKNITPAHQGTLAELHDKVVADYRHDKAVDLARQRAADLAKRAQGGEDFAKAAKSLGLDMKTSDEVARDGSITGAGTIKQYPSAFSLAVGKTGDPVFLGSDWVVYRVADHQQPNQADFDKQKKDIETQLLEAKRQLAFESFKSALEAQMKKEGKLNYNAEAMKQLTRPS
jgi:peptidyl-prolyl cis-trans isomerase D